MLIADDAAPLHLDGDAQVNLWDHRFRQLCAGMLLLSVMATSPRKGLCKVAEVAAVVVAEAVSIGLVNEAKGAAVVGT